MNSDVGGIVMKIAQAGVSKKSNAGHCAVTVRAMELPDSKMKVQVIGHVELQTDAGNLYLKDTIYVLCGSGLALARNRLELPGGLSVEVTDVSGQLNRDDEVGVCIATAVAIAKAIGKDDVNALLTDDWELFDK
jgi:hypothetical protein